MFCSARKGCDRWIPAELSFAAATFRPFARRLRLRTTRSSALLPTRACLSGIGNAYSDEILHAAQLSPIAQTRKLEPEEWVRLFEATQRTLEMWIDRLTSRGARRFPEKVTAFREDMAVHGSMANHARPAEKKSCGSGTPGTKPTTAPGARRAANPGGSRSIAAAGIGLAADARRTGSAEAALAPQKLNRPLNTTIRGAPVMPVIRPKVWELMLVSGLEKLTVLVTLMASARR